MQDYSPRIIFVQQAFDYQNEFVQAQTNPKQTNSNVP